MTSAGADFNRVALAVYRILLAWETAGRFDCGTEYNWHPRGDPPEHSSMAIGFRTDRLIFVTGYEGIIIFTATH